MKTYITIYLRSGIYQCVSKHDITPAIWIPEGCPNIRLRTQEKIRCKQMSGKAWKFTNDPFRDTTEVYCGKDYDTHPERILVRKTSGKGEILIMLDYRISEEEYLSGSEIIITPGNFNIGDLENINQGVALKLGRELDE